MSNIKFSQLPNLAQGNITSSTILPVVQGSTNYTVTTAELQTYVNSTTGNITASYFLGNGSQLTGINANYGNANVAAYLPTYTGNIGAGNISATGNITGSYILGNGSQLTGLPATYGNTQVASYLQVLTSNVSTTGNITASYLIGNGSQLTGITTTYGNSNVTSLLANFGANTISTTGLVVGNNVILNGNLAMLSGTLSVSTISASGTVTGAYYFGDGGNMSNVVNLVTAQTVAGNKTFTGSSSFTGNTTLRTYIETTAAPVNSGTSFTPVQSNGPIQRITANANFALQAPSGMVAGSSITLIITQDLSGSRTITPSAVYKWAGGIKTISTGAGSISVAMIFYDGVNYLVTLNTGYV